MNFYDMKLGDSFWHSGIGCQVVRVPGGWLFQTADSSQSSISAMSFVPFDNEFIENSANAELAATTANSDYAAAQRVIKEYRTVVTLEEENLTDFIAWNMLRLHSSTNVA